VDAKVKKLIAKLWK